MTARRSRRRLSLGIVLALSTLSGFENPAASAEDASAVAATPVKPLPEAPLGVSPKSGYRLVENWDFVHGLRDQRALRAEFATRFIYDHGSLDHVGDEWSRYRDDHNHVFVRDGLALVARREGPLAPGKIMSGMLRSRWTGRYGVFEIRMRVPRGRGLWPAFWLNPEDQHWPPEIDVVEIVNNRGPAPRRSFHFLHGKGRSGAPLSSRLGRDGAYAPGIDFSRAFHVFAVEWTPDRVRHLVDGVTVADRPFRWIHDDGEDAGPAHVLVNLAVGGKWPGPPSDETAFPARLVVAYIRIWQR